MNSKTNYALILSGGSGSRFSKDMPKQFFKVLGRSILEHCVSGFNNHKLIDKIVVVVNPTYFKLSQELVSQEKFNKIINVVKGGDTRGESSFIGLKLISEIESKSENVNVLIQDAVRPYTKHDIINKQISKLQEVNAVTLAVVSTDTVYIAGENNELLAIPNRNKVFKAQTPQAFNFNTIFEAYSKLDNLSRYTQTDDVSILNLYNPSENILILEGDIDNIKITHNQDIEYFKQILCDNCSSV